MHENAFNNPVIYWQAPKYIQHEKSVKWFIAAGIIVLLLVISSIYFNNWSFAVALITLAVVYFMMHKEEPQMVDVVISKAGIKFGNKEIPYQNIKAFWIIYEPPNIKTLHLQFTGARHDLVIQLEDQDPAELRTFLCSQVREIEGKHESFTDALIRVLKM